MVNKKRMSVVDGSIASCLLFHPIRARTHWVFSSSVPGFSDENTGAMVQPELLHWRKPPDSESVLIDRFNPLFATPFVPKMSPIGDVGSVETVYAYVDFAGSCLMTILR